MKRAFWVFLLGGFTAVSLLTFIGCTTTATGRRQLNFVSKDQEMQLGLTAFEQMKKELPISTNPQHKSLVERVGARIAEQAKAEMPEARWEFVVFESPEANAFCLPGGKVGVYTGLLPITQSEAGLATVIGHEVAHATQHHGAERMSTATAVQGVSQAGGALAGEKYSQIAMVALGGIGKLGVELPFSRKQESEADQIGLSYMARAGYDPEEAVRFWERFAASHGGKSQGPSLLRTHPVDAQRIADLKKWMPAAKQQYRGDAGAAPKKSSNAGSTVISK